MKQCSTDDMLSELTRKPLQGSNFNKSNKIVMGMKKHPKESTMKSKLQRKCIVSELQN